MTMASVDLAPKSVRLAPVFLGRNESASRRVHRTNSALAAARSEAWLAAVEVLVEMCTHLGVSATLRAA